MAVEQGFEIVNDDTSVPTDTSYAVVKQSGGLPKFFKFSNIWSWILTKIKAETLSTIDTSTANKTLPVNSSAVNSALTNYTNDNFVKNISSTSEITREISFPLKTTTWFCGEVYGNMNNYGNIAFHIAVAGATSITKTNIIGDNTKITCVIDTTNKIMKMTCDSSYSFKSITFIHS